MVIGLLWTTIVSFTPWICRENHFFWNIGRRAMQEYCEEHKPVFCRRASILILCTRTDYRVSQGTLQTISEPPLATTCWALDMPNFDYWKNSRGTFSHSCMYACIILEHKCLYFDLVRYLTASDTRLVGFDSDSSQSISELSFLRASYKV